MKKIFYLPSLLIFILIGCNSEEDPVTPEPPVEEASFYEIPENLSDYYEAVDLSLEDEALAEDLATLTISKHSKFLEYYQRHDYLYDADEDPNNPDHVILLYTGESRFWKEHFSSSNSYEPQTFNTEHIYPRSYLESNAEADLHNLRTADAEINESRSNFPYTEGEGAYQLVDNNKFFPGDEWRGDMARMIMYMNLRYNESFDQVGNLDLFLEWNAEDPVSILEKQRNEVIFEAQGNRNPFIDNPHLSTRIWGGEEANNRWDGQAESQDTVAPSIPQDVTISEVDYEWISLSWDTSIDDNNVTKYNIYVDGESHSSTTSTTVTVSDLSLGTTYTFSISAADSAGNTSEESEVVEGTTNKDNEAPTTPENFIIIRTTDSTVDLSWKAATDNVAIEGYNIYIDGEFYKTVSETTYTIAGLAPETTYSFAIASVDIYNNISEMTAAIKATTTEETEGSSGSSDLFFSEYLEGEHGYNKVLEIANVTGTAVDLSSYSIMKITNDADEWSNGYQLEGTLQSEDVLVIANADADYEGISEAADVSVDDPIVSFNGNDPLGLFKNGSLIDMIGVTGGENFAADVDLRRKTTITAPNINFIPDEWETYSSEDTADLGSF